MTWNRKSHTFTASTWAFLFLPPSPSFLLTYLFSRVKVVSKANWEPVSLHVSGAIWETCLLFLLHLFPNGDSPPRQGAGMMPARTGLYLHFHCTQLVPPCRGTAPTGRSSCCSALAGKTFELHCLTQEQAEGHLGLICLGDLRLVTSTRTSLYSGDHDRTESLILLCSILAHLFTSPSATGPKMGIWDMGPQRASCDSSGSSAVLVSLWMAGTTSQPSAGWRSKPPNNQETRSSMAAPCYVGHGSGWEQRAPTEEAGA